MASEVGMEEIERRAVKNSELGPDFEPFQHMQREGRGDECPT